MLSLSYRVTEFPVACMAVFFYKSNSVYVKPLLHLLFIFQGLIMNSVSSDSENILNLLFPVIDFLFKDV